MKVILLDNMLDDNERVIFEAGIPYEVVKNRHIVNEDGIAVTLNKIWVEYKLLDK
ncbi:hypothetical protein AB1283_01115 [Bacillus sp. S13(2024)]|uniref:hypothetical protein n=1 Tax=Bacillus sp. S13(2024) TaxID=3162885 RepID=UPI003D230BF1